MDRDLGHEANSSGFDARLDLPSPADYGDGIEPGRALIPGRDFIDFYGRSWLALLSYARRLVSDAHEAEEVVQDAFLKLFIAMPELENEGHAMAYMRRTIQNLCIDRYRKTSRRPTLSPISDEHLDIESEESAIDPVVAAEDAAVIREALARLKWEHREALIAWEIEGASTAEIAARIGVEEKNVKHTLNRARAALRRLLVGSAVDPEVDLSIPEQLSVAAARAKPVAVRVSVLVLVGVLGWRGLSAPRAGIDAQGDARARIAVPQPDADTALSNARPLGKPQVKVSLAPSPSDTSRADVPSPRVVTSVPHGSTQQQMSPAAEVSEVGGSLRALARPRVTNVAVEKPSTHAISRSIAWTYSVSTDSGVIILNERVDYGPSGLVLTVQPIVQVSGALIAADVVGQDVDVSISGGNVVLDANLVLGRAGRTLLTGTAEPTQRSFSEVPATVLLHLVMSPRLDRVLAQSVDV